MESFVFQEDVKNFKVRVEELVKENEDLHEQLNKNNFITPTEWQVILQEIHLKASYYFACCMQTFKIADLKEKSCSP